MGNSPSLRSSSRSSRRHSINTTIPLTADNALASWNFADRDRIFLLGFCSAIDLNGNTYITYAFEIVSRASSSGGGSSWFIFRRYSAFDALARALTATLQGRLGVAGDSPKNGSLPTLPAKVSPFLSFSGVLSDDECRKRSQSLLKWLRAVDYVLDNGRDSISRELFERFLRSRKNRIPYGVNETRISTFRALSAGSARVAVDTSNRSSVASDQQEREQHEHTQDSQPHTTTKNDSFVLSFISAQNDSHSHSHSLAEEEEEEVEEENEAQLRVWNSFSPIHRVGGSESIRYGSFVSASSGSTTSPSPSSSLHFITATSAACLSDTRTSLLMNSNYVSPGGNIPITHTSSSLAKNVQATCSPATNTSVVSTTSSSGGARLPSATATSASTLTSSNALLHTSAGAPIIVPRAKRSCAPPLSSSTPPPSPLPSKPTDVLQTTTGLRDMSTDATNISTGLADIFTDITDVSCSLADVSTDITDSSANLTVMCIGKQKLTLDAALFNEARNHNFGEAKVEDYDSYSSVVAAAITPPHLPAPKILTPSYQTPGDRRQIQSRPRTSSYTPSLSTRRPSAPINDNSSNNQGIFSKLVQKFSEGRSMYISPQRKTNNKEKLNMTISSAPTTTSALLIDARTLRLEAMYNRQLKIECPPCNTSRATAMLVEVNGLAIESLIGRGTYAKVFSVYDGKRGKRIALKAIEKPNTYDVPSRSAQSRLRGLERTLTELRVLTLVHMHPFVVDFYAAFQTDRYFMLGMEKCISDLESVMKSRGGRIAFGHARVYAAEIASALCFIHSKNVVVRDVKIENILIDHQGHAKLIDFGLAKMDVSSYNVGARTFCGSPEYLAPEVIRYEEYGKAVDWWGFGVLIFEMLVGHSVFWQDPMVSLSSLYLAILNATIVIPEHVNAKAGALILSLLRRSPQARLKGMGVRVDPFFEGLDWALLDQGKITNGGGEHPLLPDMLPKSMGWYRGVGNRNRIMAATTEGTPDAVAF